MAATTPRETIPRPLHERCAAVYDAFKAMGSIWSRYADADSGLILQSATIHVDDWPRLAAIVKRKANIAIDIENVQLPQRMRLSITPSDILESFMANVISGHPVSSEQLDQWKEALFGTTAALFKVSIEEAETVNLMEAGDTQIAAINQAFSACILDDYVTRMIQEFQEREPCAIRLADLLEVLYSYLL